VKALGASVLIVVLALLSAGPLLESAAVMRLFDRDRNDFRVRERMRETLDEIVRRFDALTEIGADDGEHPLLEGLKAEYAAYGLEIRDISSGLNLNFLPEADLSESALAAFLFVSGSAGSFCAFRRSRGFVSDADEWKPYLTDEAQRAVTVYGWLPEMHGDSEAGAVLAAVFGSGGEGLYPLVNGMAPVNVNTVYPGVLKPLLARASWRIPGAAAKAEQLESRRSGGALTEGDLRAVLGVPAGHEVYRYLGVRTAFWGIRFTGGRYRMDAVIAAIPERGSGAAGVKEYRLIEGRLNRV
jgi:hypothetical protein